MHCAARVDADGKIVFESNTKRPFKKLAHGSFGFCFQVLAVNADFSDGAWREGNDGSVKLGEHFFRINSRGLRKIKGSCGK